MIKIIILVGFLSYGPAMPSVLVIRQTANVTYKLPKTLKHYDCLLGLPYGYQSFIGSEVFIKTNTHIYGPYLAVDVEAPHHYPYMKDNNLAADISCQNLVHKEVSLLVEVRRGLKE